MQIEDSPTQTQAAFRETMAAVWHACGGNHLRWAKIAVRNDGQCVRVVVHDTADAAGIAEPAIGSAEG